MMKPFVTGPILSVSVTPQLLAVRDAVLLLVGEMLG